MKNQLTPCLWFDGKAKEAAAFYCSVFPDSTITDESPVVVNFESAGQRFMCLNGGPEFTFNPSISFYVVCESENEINNTWQRLLEGGSVQMPFDTYEWSDKYGWLRDRYGVNWQLSLGRIEDIGQKFTPVLMFTEKQHGKALQTIRFYTSVFKNSSIVMIMNYSKKDNEIEGTIKHAQFKLGEQVFMAMDSSLMHGFSFNEAVSFLVECETQDEIDYYWNNLTEGGEEVQCGWLKDKFGISWQVVPAILKELMSDPSRSERVTKAFLKMKKFNIDALMNA